MTNERLDSMREAVVSSFLAECNRLKLSCTTIGGLTSTNRVTAYYWRKGKSKPTEFTAVMAMLEITPTLATLTEDQARPIRRKRNAAQMILDLAASKG